MAVGRARSSWSAIWSRRRSSWSASSGCHGFGEVGGFEDGADFDFAGAEHRVGGALDPLHGLVHVLDLPEPIAGDQFTGRVEGAVDDGAAVAVKAHALTLGRWSQTVASEQDAGIGEFAGVGAPWPG